jgi:predicted transposase/invertase (TIGR01784 family)
LFVSEVTTTERFSSTRYYVDEMTNEAHIGLNILFMMGSKPDDSLARAKYLVPHVKAVMEDDEKRRTVIELIETVIVYQFPKMSREEVEKMLQVEDFRETRIYQEAVAEGIEKGLEQGIEQGEAKAAAGFARKLLAKKRPIEEIVELTGLTPVQIKKLKKKPSR